MLRPAAALVKLPCLDFCLGSRTDDLHGDGTVDGTALTLLRERIIAVGRSQHVDMRQEWVCPKMEPLWLLLLLLLPLHC